MLARLTVTQEHHGKLGFHLRSEHRGKKTELEAREVGCVGSIAVCLWVAHLTSLS